MRIDRVTVIASVSAAALFVGTVLVGAQAPAVPQAAAAPQAPARQGAAPAAPQGPTAGRGGLPGTESGWATFQGQ